MTEFEFGARDPLPRRDGGLEQCGELRHGGAQRVERGPIQECGEIEGQHLRRRRIGEEQDSAVVDGQDAGPDVGEDIAFPQSDRCEFGGERFERGANCPICVGL